MKLSKNLLILLSFILLILPNNAFANTNNKLFTYDQYLKGIEDGWISEDVSYDYLLKLNEESIRFEKMLEENNDFYEITLDSKLIPGDIIVTNGTSSSGITGHAAIVLDDNNFFHIQGSNYKPESVSRSWFVNKYKNEGKGWIKVFRPKVSKNGINAANWVLGTYKNSNAKYKITTDLKSTDTTYCSKIVWQGYRYGAGANSVKNPNYDKKPMIVSPYSLEKEVLNLDKKDNLNKEIDNSIEIFDSSKKAIDNLNDYGDIKINKEDYKAYTEIEFTKEELKLISHDELRDDNGITVGGKLLIPAELSKEEQQFIKKEFIENNKNYNKDYIEIYKDNKNNFLKDITRSLKVKNVKFLGGGFYFPDKRLASATGDGGVTVTIDTNKEEKSNYTSNISISPSIVSAGVGFDVTKAHSIRIQGSWTIPEGKRGTLEAYAKFDKYSFEIWNKILNNEKYEGSGYAYNVNNGVFFKTVIH